MENYRVKTHLSVLAGFVFILNGCGGNSSSSLDTTTQTDTDPTQKIVSNYTPDDGRLLASGCFQCHGTDGVSVNQWDSIIGEDELHKEMFEKDGIMLSQAKGYSDSEITSMQNYLSSISKDSNYNDEGDNDD